jgi:hypothetical protein
MLSLLLRRTLVALSVLSSLAAARSARAEDVPSTVRIESDDNLEVFARTDQVTSVPMWSRYGARMMRAPVYSPVCAHTPCVPQLADGTYHLGLSKAGGNVVEADAPVDLNGSATLHATYHDRSVWRGLGLVTAIAAPLAGTAVMLTGRSNTSVDPPPARIAAGLGIMTAGLIVSLIMVFQPDTAEFSISPYAIGTAPGVRESGVGSAIPNGLQLTMRF